MRELVLASLKHHGRRYAATIIAVTIAVAFVAAALVFGGSLNAGIRQGIAGAYDGSAAVVTNSGESEVPQLHTAQELAASLPGVAETYASISQGFEVVGAGGGHADWASASLLGGTHLGSVKLTDGQLPSTAFEALATAELAERLNLSVGSALTLRGYDEQGNGPEVPLSISGIVDAPRQSMMLMSQDLRISAEALSALDPRWEPFEIMIATSNPSPTKDEQQQLVAELEALFETHSETGLLVQATHVVVDEQLAQLDLAEGPLTLMLLLFPIIAAVVALIVVGTTFQVIFAQRERELALLRAIGASGRQVRSLMLWESAAVGLLGSMIGLGIGVLGGAAIAAGVGVVSTYALALGSVSFTQLLSVLVIATLLTALAGFRPALRAARVPPILALAGNTKSVKVMSKRAKVVAAVAGAVSIALAVLTWVLADVPEDAKEEGFLITLFVAVLTAAAVITLVAAALPLLTRWAGRFGRGQAYRLAAANTGRNPGRTAATGIAIFIGVTLISMVTFGAQSLRATVHAGLDRSAPVDLIASAPLDGFSDEDLRQLQEVDGVEAAEVVTGVFGSADLPGRGTTQGLIIDGSNIGPVIRGNLPAIADGQVLLPFFEQSAGDQTQVCAEDSCVDLTAISTGPLAGYDRFITTAQTFDQLGVTASPVQVWFKLSNPDDFARVIAGIQSVDAGINLDGQVAMRATIDSIMNVVVMVIIGLLAVSILVALVGITNTLSLSVTERTRENGLLRALGMTKGQVRAMLSWEALLIALSATFAGLVAGAYFGWVGFLALPLGVSTRVVAVPWLQWAAIVAIAVAAAWVASVMPGRKAAKASPVEALATE